MNMPGLFLSVVCRFQRVDATLDPLLMLSDELPDPLPEEREIVLANRILVGMVSVIKTGCVSRSNIVLMRTRATLLRCQAHTGHNRWLHPIGTAIGVFWLHSRTHVSDPL